MLNYLVPLRVSWISWNASVSNAASSQVRSNPFGREVSPPNLHEIHMVHGFLVTNLPKKWFFHVDIRMERGMSMGVSYSFQAICCQKTHTQVFAQNKLEKVQTLIDLINPDKTQNIWLFIDPGLTLPWMKRLKRTHKRRRGVRWGLEERAILPQNIISKHRNVDMRLETKSCINWYLFIATKICAVLAKWQEGFPRRFEGSQTADRPSNGTLTPTWSIFPCPLEPVWEPQNFPPPKKNMKIPHGLCVTSLSSYHKNLLILLNVELPESNG